MTSPTEEFTPVRVHISGSDLQNDIARVRPQRLAATPRTIVLTANQSFMPLVGHEPNRKVLMVLSLDNPVVISDSAGAAGQNSNQGATFPNPDGAILPVLQNYTPIETTDQLWVSAGVFPSRVSVINISNAEQ